MVPTLVCSKNSEDCDAKAFCIELESLNLCCLRGSICRMQMRSWTAMISTKCKFLGRCLCNCEAGTGGFGHSRRGGFRTVIRLDRGLRSAVHLRQHGSVARNLSSIFYMTRATVPLMLKACAGSNSMASPNPLSMPPMTGLPIGRPRPRSSE